MADLVTHTCAVWLPGLLARWRWTGVCVVGTAIPDVFGRAVPLAVDLVDRRLVGLPEAAVYPWSALHEPLGASLVCGLLACAFVREERGAAFRAAWLGMWAHTALDLTQDHHGAGYLVAAPFSLRTFELGWIGSEATVGLALPLLGLTLAITGWRGAQKWAASTPSR